MSQTNTPATAAKRSIVEVFMGGCKRGFYIGADQILPAMVLGFAFIQFLQLAGLVPILGVVFGPVMGIFGLPGETIAVIVAAFFSKAAGAGTAANMYMEGLITARHATVLIMPSMLMGTLVGHYARIVLVADTNKSHHAAMLGIPIVGSMLGMWITQAVLMFM